MPRALARQAVSGPGVFVPAGKTCRSAPRRAKPDAPLNRCAHRTGLAGSLYRPAKPADPLRVGQSPTLRSIDAPTGQVLPAPLLQASAQRSCLAADLGIVGQL